MRILLAILLNAAALAVTAFLVPGVSVSSWSSEPLAIVLGYLAVGTIFGVVNVTIKPIVQILSLPLTCLTLGLFAIVINALMLLLTAWLTELTPVTLSIDGFLAALLGAIVVSVVSALLNRFLLSTGNSV